MSSQLIRSLNRCLAQGTLKSPLLGFGKGSMDNFTFEHAHLCGHLSSVKCHEHSVAAVEALWAHPHAAAWHTRRRGGRRGAGRAGPDSASHAQVCTQCYRATMASEF